MTSSPDTHTETREEAEPSVLLCNCTRVCFPKEDKPGCVQIIINFSKCGRIQCIWCLDLYSSKHYLLTGCQGEVLLLWLPEAEYISYVLIWSKENADLHGQSTSEITYFHSSDAHQTIKRQDPVRLDWDVLARNNRIKCHIAHERPLFAIKSISRNRMMKDFNHWPRKKTPK